MSPHSFSTWMQQLDELCYTNLGMSYQNLPDQPFRDWYDEGYTPLDAFYEMTEAAYPGADFDNVYYQEFDTFTDANPGL